MPSGVRTGGPAGRASPGSADHRGTDLASRLATIELVDDSGNPVRVGSAWSERTALLVFIRHFG